MLAKFLTTASVVAALAIAPADRADADAAEFIGGAIIGGIIGNAISQGNRGTRTTRVVRPGIPATQQGRETQAALNYFGFNAGTVDGQVGNGTRAAIERYQRAMNYPVNGREFPSYQFDYLMDAYYWAQNGGSAQTRLAGQPLLFAYRDSLQGRSVIASAPAQLAPTAPATTVIVAPQGSTSVVPAPLAAPAPTVSASAPAPTAPGTMPNLFANATPRSSLANTCNGVMLQTSTNGGYVTTASMSDPGFALSEQFCVARTYAMSQGEELMQGIVGLTRAQIAEQCGAFTSLLSAEIDRASLVGQAELVPEMREFALSTGIAPADLASTSRVCLAVGYAQDDMRMAVGATLVLVSMGEMAYGELLGHHLREGFGTTVRQDLAMGWYNASLSAVERGTPPAFMPGQPERHAVLRQATQRMQSGQPAAPTPVPATQPAQTLPTFTVNQ